MASPTTSTNRSSHLARTASGRRATSNAQIFCARCSATAVLGSSLDVMRNAKSSIFVRDRQFLGREQRDHAATFVGDDDLFLDARGGEAVRGGAIGFQR